MDSRPDHEAEWAALCTLGAAGCADLLQPGVLEEAWIGMERVTWAASRGVAAAVTAYSPLQKEEVAIGP
ncbi:hypothetical protein NDU88_006238 [Pleurodeles waltl]|uniref:Uncharacterized protein n=1 Tax=Pleurodeles waltl TaxID=8319 RepID=A0AAV7TWJ8_PLEWA|nr:hypothetical protein NDU88_006238 [Pleurodeles waltl]